MFNLALHKLNLLVYYGDNKILNLEKDKKEYQNSIGNKHSGERRNCNCATMVIVSRRVGYILCAMCFKEIEVAKLASNYKIQCCHIQF